VRDGADRLGVAEADDKPPVDNLENTAFRLRRGIGRLIEEATHLAVAMRRSTAVIAAGDLLVTRTRANLGGEALRRWKRGGRQPDFGDDLLRRIDSKPRDGRRALHGLLVLTQQQGEFAIERLLVCVQEP
jgi:hypothetical protein